MVFQIFRGRPRKELALKVLGAFDLKGVHDSTPFTRAEIQRRNTPARLEAIEELPAAYLPCKASYAAPPLNVSKSLTILRHMLKALDAKLESSEMCVSGSKIVVYRVRVEGAGNCVIHVVRAPTTMFGAPGDAAAAAQPGAAAVVPNPRPDDADDGYHSDWE